MKKDFTKKLLITCNPWFLASTILLLLGIYLVYADPSLQDQDEFQIYLTFFSINIYEFLCIGVAFCWLLCFY